MERLLNFNEPLDVGLLDQVVAAVYAGNDQQVCCLVTSLPSFALAC